jgi:hypothetical protein
MIKNASMHCCRSSKIIFLFVILAGYYPGNVTAQYRQPQVIQQDTTAHKGFDPQKLFIGGNLGLSFGDITYLNLSPTIGYRFSSLLAAGIQINAQYESVRYTDQYNRLYKKERYGVLGAGIFGRVYPITQLFVHVQPEMNFIIGKVRYYDGSTAEQKYHDRVPSFLAGGGYEQPVGRGNSAFTIMVLYDVLQRDDSPYGNKPIFRAGVNLGL